MNDQPHDADPDARVPFTGRQRLAAGLVVGGGILLTAALGMLVIAVDRAESRRLVDEGAQAIAKDLQTEANAFVQFARTAEAFASIQSSMTRLEFEAFVRPMKRERPALESIAIAMRVAPQDQLELVQRRRTAGFADFALPASVSAEDDAVVVLHVQPSTPEVKAELGREVHESPESRTAVNEALADPTRAFAVRTGEQLCVFVGMSDRRDDAVISLMTEVGPTTPLAALVEHDGVADGVADGVVILRIDLTQMIAANTPAGATVQIVDTDTPCCPITARHDIELAGSVVPLLVEPASAPASLAGSLRLLLALGMGLAVTGLGFAVADRSIRRGNAAENQRREIQAVVLARTAELREQAEELTVARDRAEAAMRVKSAFLTVMSHEIRTPVNAIAGFCDLLEDDDASADELRDRRETVQRNGRHLARLITDILEFSSLEAGQVIVEPREVPVDAFLADLLDPVRRRAAEAGLQFHGRIAPDLPALIRIDPVRLTQVAGGLLDNAIKFTDSGSVTFGLDVDPDDPERLRLWVQDTGPGIDPRHAGNLFEPFSQIDDGMDRPFGGTGLGLALAQRVAATFDGVVRHVPPAAPSRGTRFEVNFPARSIGSDRLGQSAANDHSRTTNPADPDMVRPTAANVASTELLAGTRILVAEDGADNRRLIGFLLTKAGAEVELVEDGRMALQRMLDPDAPGIDLLVSDMQMPVMDGYASVAAMRASGIRVPVIALTAHAMATDRTRCLNAGCDDYLHKPVDRAALIECCQRWIDGEDSAASPRPGSSKVRPAA